MTVQTLVYQAAAFLLFVLAYQAIGIPQNPTEYQIKTPCFQTGELCVDVTECCSRNDVCLKRPLNLMDPNAPSRNGRTGRCVNLQVTDQMNLLRSGELCTDSHQCRDRCCREVLAFKVRISTCGIPFHDFAYHCISPALDNNIPGDI